MDLKFGNPKFNMLSKIAFIFCHKMLKLWNSEVIEAILEQVTVAK